MKRDYDILEEKPEPTALSKGDVLFEDDTKNAKSCFNCPLYLINDKLCAIHCDEIIIASVRLKGKTYSPVCGFHVPGKPTTENTDELIELSEVEPEYSGLVWVEGKGTTCGGLYESSLCASHYTGNDTEGFCRVLQDTVNAGECCAAWKNGSKTLSWSEAQEELKK